MVDFFDSLQTSQVLFAIAALAAVVSALAALRERRERARRDLDRVSPVSWGLVSAVGMLLAVACSAYALHAG